MAGKILETCLNKCYPTQIINIKSFTMTGFVINDAVCRHFQSAVISLWICLSCVLLSFYNTLFPLPSDSSGPMSTAHTHPPHMGGIVGHPSVISTSRPLPSPMSTLGSPMNGLASPYPVITTSLGSPSVSLQSTPNMNFGPLSSPPVRKCVGVLMVIRQL